MLGFNVLTINSLLQSFFAVSKAESIIKPQEANTIHQPITVIGAGLAGTEAAFQITNRGWPVHLWEMRPSHTTPAHQTDRFAELVCSNSLKSERPDSAPWLLKEELRRIGSLSMEAASNARVPGGQALTVDRDLFAAYITEEIEHNPLIEIIRREVSQIPIDQVTVIASGPLTSDSLANAIVALTGSERLFFYDAISPIVEAETVNMGIAFRASRWGRSIDGTDDYLNCPMDRSEYERFYQALIEAKQHKGHDFENPNYFESCLPIEELGRRGVDTLRFGPMKPVGLRDPRTGNVPYAVVQLRQEDLRAGSYNLVGFQNYLRYPEQKKILRMIPGLEEAEFLRFGQIHRNTYINGPELLTSALELRSNPNIFFAGQIAGVEGYVESMAGGLMAGRNAVRRVKGLKTVTWPRTTAHGALAHYISGANPNNYQPANITFDLLPPLSVDEPIHIRRNKTTRRKRQCEVALESLDHFLKEEKMALSGSVNAVV